MKTVSAHYTQTNYEVPVDLKTMQHNRHFHIKIPTINIIEILVKPGNRFKWMGVTMIVQSILITPIISIIILYTGNWFPLWIITIASMYATYIPSLSGQELKWIKAVFFINCLVSLLVIITAFIRLLIV